MYKINDVIDGKYLVTGTCSEAGGMGAILFVQSAQSNPYQLVLKYCRELSEESITRFRRESRLLATYAGNSRVVNVVDSNSDHDPPYIVMQYYPSGDLAHNANNIRSSFEAFESAILQMIDCLQELHSKGHFHRDIKPQNFLIDGNRIVISDFGLSTEIGSSTAFTRSSVWWGTHGYIPPEFLMGNFKYPDAASDIFMLGKTIYVLATGRGALYLIPDDVPPPLYHVIDKCCQITKDLRYQSLSELRQSLISAFDVIIGRGGGLGEVHKILETIINKLHSERKYDSNHVSCFVEKLALLGRAEKIKISMELPEDFFTMFSQRQLSPISMSFLSIYDEMVESQVYGWSFSETIVKNMGILFTSPDATNESKAYALDMAIRAAAYMNRFAAMDFCRNLVREVKDDNLGQAVAALINKHRGSFIDSIEPSECKNDSVIRALIANKK